jgi:hypothetical protein
VTYFGVIPEFPGGTKCNIVSIECRRVPANIQKSSETVSVSRTLAFLAISRRAWVYPKVSGLAA